MKHLEALIGPWVIRHRWWLIATTLVVSLVAASGMRFLTFNNDLRANWRTPIIKLTMYTLQLLLKTVIFLAGKPLPLLRN